jgi:hypothetical protein
MHKTVTLAAIMVAAVSGSASAGGQEGSVGVGAEFALNGDTGGVSVNYDAGAFHVGGFLGFFDQPGDDNTDFTIGARFFYHLHSTAMSDFGIGGTFGFYSEDRPAPLDREALMYLEPSFQIRLFVASNVALSFTAGLVIGLVDADGFAIGGGLGFGGTPGLGAVNAAAGVHYYFF